MLFLVRQPLLIFLMTTKHNQNNHLHSTQKFAVSILDLLYFQLFYMIAFWLYCGYNIRSEEDILYKCGGGGENAVNSNLSCEIPLTCIIKKDRLNRERRE